MELQTEEWIEEGEKIAIQQKQGTRGLTDDERNELWQWAPGAANKEARRQKWGADYTLEEIQRGIANVVTGLRRELVEPPEDDLDGEEEEEDEYEVTDDEEEEDEDKMEVEQVKPESKPGLSATSLPVQRSVAQMPLQNIHKYMTTGR